MLLDDSIKEHNVDGRIICIYRYIKRIGLPPAKRFILSHRARLSHVPFYHREAMVTCARIQSSHAAWCCLMESVAVRFQHHLVLSGASCVFIYISSGEFILVLRFWISSCTCCGTVAPSSLYWHHVHLLHHVVIALLLPLLRGFTPASRTEHIPKYSSIEKFIKLSFQRVLIRLNRSPNEGAMAVSLQHCLLFSARTTFGDSAISACRNLRWPCRLIRWTIDFMGILKIHIYLVVFCWGSCKHRDDIVILSSIDPEMHVWSLSWSLLGHHVTHPLASKLLPLLHEHDGNGIFHHRAWHGRFQNL